MNQRNTTSILVYLLVLAFLILFSMIVSADNVGQESGYIKVCLKNGESIPVSSTSSYTCVLRSGLGFCQVCANSSFAYASWNKCYGVSGCTPLGGVPQVNLTLTVNSPKNSSIFTKGNVQLSLYTNKIARITLLDYVGKNSKLLCANCKSYYQSMLFPEGYNKIAITASVDGQSQTIAREFFIDSKKPRITKTLPSSNAYASGTFTITYDENNVKSMVLHYGNKISVKVVNGTCQSGMKQTCNVIANISVYENDPNFNYWFTLTDVVGNKVDSRAIKVKVDTIMPKINSINYTKRLKTATLIINVTEVNLNRIEYANMNGDGKFKILCTSLTKGLCTKSISFPNYGNYELMIKVSDKAAHQIVTTMNVAI